MHCLIKGIVRNLSKSIDSLVEDIYSLFDSNRTLDKRNLKYFLDDLSKILLDRFSKMSDDRRTLRLSQIGKPLRQIWYEIKGFPKEPLKAYHKIKFLYGDILEAFLLFLAREAGHTVTEQQKVVVVDGVKGHKDGRIDGILTDVKSASTRSFSKFKDGSLLDNDPFGYAAQLAAYMEKEDKEAAWLAIDKQFGHIALLKVHDLQLPDVTKRIQKVKEVCSSDTPPERCYEPVKYGEKGNLVLCTECSYCPFFRECWKDSNNGEGIKTFLYSTGPKHFIKIVEMPRVLEIKDKDNNAETN